MSIGREGNVTKLRLLYDKNIIKKVGEIVSSAFLHFKGNTNRQIHICLKTYEIDATYATLYKKP